MIVHSFIHSLRIYVTGQHWLTFSPGAENGDQWWLDWPVSFAYTLEVFMNELDWLLLATAERSSPPSPNDFMNESR